MFRIAEESLLKRRAQPADMGAAVSAALVDALGGDPPPTGAVAAGRLLADGVVAHAASFGPGREPAYHDQRHQAEATVAMGWLCAKARDLGQLTSEMAAIGVLAMAGHDLLHDGTWPGAGVLEARSAGFAVTLGAQAGLDAETLATIHRVILATDPFRPKAVRDADDLLCRLAQEADVFGSLTPGLVGSSARLWRARQMQPGTATIRQSHPLRDDWCCCVGSSIPRKSPRNLA